ncbi:hypothetical protein BJQ94_13225 [Cryobacterium sp. SO2]|uniref:hypothetical protein n=1 Tax=Cryobacterium sp. SO2 TaxID=1897060 RepID=UPI00223DF996|nr:hypothetical protein [Cryobacterium sp. SO2]WEO76320.1 hypothetical protein BJQ94_13225 [Cryobacterium sp. SO2]
MPDATTAAAPPASDELGRSGVDTQLARTAWAQASVRRFASQTNLLVASSRVLIVGAGPLADELAHALSTMGARVAVSGTDAAALYAFARRGLDTHQVGPAGLLIPAETDLVFATGEEPTPLTPAALGAADAAAAHPLVIVDAAEPGRPAAVDLAAFAAHPALTARDAIRGFALHRDVFVISVAHLETTADAHAGEARA